MKTAEQIIKDLGGPTEVARHTDFTDGAVRQWAFKKRIPRKAWLTLVETFPGKVSFDDLKSAEGGSRARQSRNEGASA